MDGLLRGRVVVLSPHLDDAVFSLGAGIAAAVRAGATVAVVTPFAGDPRSRAPAAWWDSRAGFETEGEAARARREEDRDACGIVGATPVWLPFRDASYGGRADDETVWTAVQDAVRGADVVVGPGYPSVHPDHAWLSRTLLQRGLDGARIALYVEQPYAFRAPDEAPRGGGVRWNSVASSGTDRRSKRRAALCYRSQLPLFGRASLPLSGRLLLARVAAYERRYGGEQLAWVDDSC